TPTSPEALTSAFAGDHSIANPGAEDISTQVWRIDADPVTTGMPGEYTLASGAKYDRNLFGSFALADHSRSTRIRASFSWVTLTVDPHPAERPANTSHPIQRRIRHLRGSVFSMVGISSHNDTSALDSGPFLFLLSSRDWGSGILETVRLLEPVGDGRLNLIPVDDVHKVGDLDLRGRHRFLDQR